MRVHSLGFVALSGFGLLVDAGLIHVDVAVNVDTKQQSSENAKPGQSGKPVRVLEDYQVDLEYEIHSGSLSDSGTYVTFKNIPYAEPPTGENRFLEPIPVQTSREDINDGSKSYICPQAQVGWVPKAMDFLNDFPNVTALYNWRDPITPDQYGPIEYPDKEANEDCLFLDVMVPKSVWDKRNSSITGAAVVVWVHGGGFVYGWKDQYGSPAGLFDAGAKDKRQNIIYVSMNYRLGAFGWLGGPKFQDDGGRANVGLLDQAFAMKWVKDNIWKFGGTSSRISMMGQSAGASSIMHHITAYGGKSGIIHSRPQMQGAILQSPGFFPQPNSTQDDEVYKTFLKLAKVDNLEALFTADTQALQDANAIMIHDSKYGYFDFGPTIDHSYVPDLPGKVLLQSDFPVPAMLLGDMKLDGLLFTPPWIRTTQALLDHVKKLFPGVPDSVLTTIEEKYPVTSPFNPQGALLKVADFLDDIAIQCNNYYLTEASFKSNSESYHPVYRYAFNALPAVHGYDTGYTYYPSPSLFPGIDPALAKYFQQTIVDFARYRDPNPEDSDTWNEYTPTNRKVMNMGNPGQLTAPDYTWSLGPDLMDLTRCQYWQNAPYYVPDASSGAEFVVQDGKLRQDL